MRMLFNLTQKPNMLETSANIYYVILLVVSVCFLGRKSSKIEGLLLSSLMVKLFLSLLLNLCCSSVSSARVYLWMEP